MTPTEIEAWARRVMDRVVRGEPNEDARVELKREWIDDPSDMARRVAAHANAARTDRILWLIGVDQKAGAVPGVPERDAAQWLPQVVSHFDSVAPVLVDVAVHRGDKTVMALLFETDRPPYVVRNPAFGKDGVRIQYEVPWRDGTSVRSARREDLFRILVPQSTLPQCEVRSAATKDASGAPGAGYAASLFLIWLYIVPSSAERSYVPFHRCFVRIRTPGLEWVRLESVYFEEDVGRLNGLRPPGGPRDSHSMAATETELVVDGAAEGPWSWGRARL